MADKEENTETKAAPKKKAAPKAKAKSEAKPKTATVTKAKTADAAPYLKKDINTESSPAEPSKQKPFTLLAIIAVFIIIIIITIYKLDAQINGISAQVDTQDNAGASIATSVAAPVAVMQPEQVASEEETPAAVTPIQQAPPATQEAPEQSRTQPQQRAEQHRETMQQRRQAFEKEMQSKKQEYEAIVSAHEKERAKLAAEQDDVMQRMRQNHMETKSKVDEIRKQIFELHEKIRQIMRESSPVRQQP